MAIASPSTPTFSATFCCTRTVSTRSPTRSPSSISFTRRLQPHPPLTRRLAISSRLNSSKPSGAGGSLSPDNGGGSEHIQYELYHKFSSPQRRRLGAPVFVTLPVDSVSTGGQVRRLKVMAQSFKALSAAGVEGVVVEVWWGLVERDEPGVYNWQRYLDLVSSLFDGGETGSGSRRYRVGMRESEVK